MVSRRQFVSYTIGHSNLPQLRTLFFIDHRTRREVIGAETRQIERLEEGHEW